MDSPLRIAYFGHHKCASTWVHRILSFVAAEAGWKTSYIHNSGQFEGEPSAFVKRTGVTVLSYVNAEILDVRALGEVRGFHVIRDPRDLIVSAYFSHLNSHPTDGWPELETHRTRIQSLDQEEGMRAEFVFSAKVLNDLSEWDYQQPGILEFRQERLTLDAFQGFQEIFLHCGLLRGDNDATPGKLARRLLYRWNLIAGHRRRLPTIGVDTIDRGRLEAAVAENHFKSLSGGRKPGVEDRGSHYRSGVSGDWRRYFSEDLVREFKALFPGLVAQLGYEEDEGWGLREES